MPYTGSDVLKNFIVSSDTSRTERSIEDVFKAMKGRTYRASFKVGNETICNDNVIDVIAIGIDKSRGGLFEPVVCSLDYLPFMQSGLTIATPGTGMFNAATPVSSNYWKTLGVPSIKTTTDTLKRCNNYMNTSRGMPYCGPSSDGNYKAKPSAQQYWSSREEALAGYDTQANKDSYNANNGCTEFTYLFYTFEIINELQRRMGYRIPNDTDPYHWSNWLVASGDGSWRYYKIMYLTEFDYYMHAGAMKNYDFWLDGYLSKNFYFDGMINQIVNPNFAMNLKMDKDVKYLNRNCLDKGDKLIAGDFIYSRDYKFKLHLGLYGDLRVWEFPMTKDSTCKYQIFTPGWDQARDNFRFAYLAVQDDGNIVVYVNPNADFTGGDAKSNTGTNNNAYFAMEKYRVIVAPGGAFVALNGGLRSKLGADSVTYVAGGDSVQWFSTEDANNIQCIHGWKYADASGNGVPNLNQILTLTTQNNNNANWCYKNPFIEYTDSDGTLYKFTKTEFQQVLWRIGELDPATDYIYNFITSTFLPKARSLGWGGLQDDITKGEGARITTNYCMRGNRWVSESTCGNFARNTRLLTTFPANLKSLIDFDIKKRICANSTTQQEKDLCYFVNPNAITVPILGSLAKIDTRFAELNKNIPTTAYGASTLTGITPNYAALVTTLLTAYSTYTEQQLMYIRDFIPLDAADTLWTLWQSRYKTNLNIPDVPSRTDVDTSVAQQDFIVFKNSNGLVINKFTLDSNIIKAKGVFSNGVANRYTSGDLIWKYIVALINPKFKPAASVTIDEANNNGFEVPTTTAFFPYDVDVWKYETGTQVYDVYVFRGKSNKDWINYYRSRLQANNKTVFDQANTNAYCLKNRDDCFDDYLNTANNNSYVTGGTLDLLCDVAKAPTTSATDKAFFSTTNASQLLNICNTKYASTSCSKPELRYKSSFTNKEPFISKANKKSRNIIKGTSNYGPRFEMFSGTDCASACNDTNASAEVQAACKTGSLAYCALTDNIFGEACTKDMAKYPELTPIKNEWCAKNTTHSNYLKYCKPTPFVTPTTPPVIVSTTTPLPPVLVAPPSTVVAAAPIPVGDTAAPTPATNDISKSTTSTPIDTTVTTPANVNTSTTPIQQISSNPINTTPSAEAKDDGLSAGAWAGIIIAILIIIGAIIFALIKLRAKKKLATVSPSNPLNVTPFASATPSPVSLSVPPPPMDTMFTPTVQPMASTFTPSTPVPSLGLPANLPMAPVTPMSIPLKS